jgi:hypothetical protein
VSEIDFIVGNISLFADQLRWETSQVRREALKRLLINEENRLGKHEKHSELAKRILREGTELISRQTRLIAKMKAVGADTGLAERALGSFQSYQSLIEEIHNSHVN